MFFPLWISILEGLKNWVFTNSNNLQFFTKEKLECIFLDRTGTEKINIESSSMCTINLFYLHFSEIRFRNTSVNSGH